eukprot:m.90807 g.90807  ORF g.90807 m.90807 type:complete len:170 (+) comp12317_c1_seq1:2328-2837(+)
MDGMKTMAVQMTELVQPQGEYDTELIESGTEQLLARLDASAGLLQSLSLEREELLNVILNSMKENTQVLEDLFRRIDEIETFVEFVKSKMNEVEAQISSMEEKKNVMSFFKKKSWFGRKKKVTEDTSPAKVVERISLWDTSVVFHGEQQQAQREELKMEEEQEVEDGRE